MLTYFKDRVVLKRNGDIRTPTVVQTSVSYDRKSLYSEK